MRTVTRIIRRSPDACWRAFIDPSLMTGWVPKLRRARVVTTYPTGLAKEINLEFSTELTTSLLYTYDIPAREVKWKPRVGEINAGFARVEPVEEGTRLTYGLEVTADEAKLVGDPDKLLAEFVTWMHAY